MDIIKVPGLLPQPFFEVDTLSQAQPSMWPDVPAVPGLPTRNFKTSRGGGEIQPVLRGGEVEWGFCSPKLGVSGSQPWLPIGISRGAFKVLMPESHPQRFWFNQSGVQHKHRDF